MISKKRHRGEILETAIKNSGIAIKVVTARAGYSRSSYYNHITNDNLSLHIILKYGEAINFDFSEMIPEIRRIEQVEFGNPKNLREAKKQINILKEKYYNLLEKYNSYLEKDNY